MRLLRKKQNKKTYNPIVPNGLIAQTEKGYFYIKNKKKFKFVSDRAMVSWTLPIVQTKDATLSGYQLMGSLGFRDGTLVKDISDGKIYLISDSKRRHIVEPDILEWLDADVISVGQKEILAHEEGEELNGNNT
jgi:hypothetical protein